MYDLRLSLGLILYLVAGCQTPESNEPYHVSRFAMGTIVEYTIASMSGATDHNAAARDMVDLAHDELERVSTLFGESDSLSAIYMFNRSADSAKVGTEVLSFIERSRRYYADTQGAFDITIGTVLSLYDFASESPIPPATEEINLLLQSVGIDEFRPGKDGYLVKSRSDVSLSVGGVAKGYGVDRAIDVLRGLGVQGALINAGGDLFCLGTNGGRPWRVGIRDPDDRNAVLQILHVTDEAVATSGDYQQFFMHEGIRYHHILSPSNGKPVRGVRSATVIAATAERADALATAAFVLGPKKGIEMLELLGANGLLIDSTGQTHATTGMSQYLDHDQGNREPSS